MIVAKNPRKQAQEFMVCQTHTILRNGPTRTHNYDVMSDFQIASETNSKDRHSLSADGER